MRSTTTRGGVAHLMGTGLFVSATKERTTVAEDARATIGRIAAQSRCSARESLIGGSMKTNRFDQLTRDFATTRSRRGFMKLLAGAALAMGSTAVRVPSLLAATCVDANGECTVDGDCCGRLTCQEDGTCGGPSAGSECAGDDECADGEICCGGTCAAIACCIDDEDPNARCAAGTSCFEGYCDPIETTTVETGTGGTTVLPGTGTGGSDDHSASMLLGAAVLGGAAAAAAALGGAAAAAIGYNLAK